MDTPLLLLLLVYLFDLSIVLGTPLLFLPFLLLFLLLLDRIVLVGESVDGRMEGEFDGWREGRTEGGREGGRV